VARAYLGRPAARERLIVVAGESRAATASSCRSLQRAAAQMGISSVLVQRGMETVDLELASDAHPALVIYHHGEVSEAELGQLGTPPREGVDLLIWCPVPGNGPRWIYLLSLWVWSLLPSQVRCVVDASVLGGFDLGALRFRLCKGLRRAQIGEGTELLRRPEDRQEEATSMFYQQILQSLLSSSPRRRLRRGAARVSRATVVGLACLFSFLGWVDAGVAQESPAADSLPTALVEMLDFEDAQDTKIASRDGAILFHGPDYSLRHEPGVGAWSSDRSTFTLTSRRSATTFELDGKPVEWGSGRHRVKEEFVAHSREYSLLLSRGRVEMLADRVVVHAILGNNPLAGRGGVFIALALAGVIFFLLWRANSLQRRLEKPRVSLRQRSSPADGDL
jgi:hypothetical protein